MLSAIMVNVTCEPFTLSVVMLNVVMLSVTIYLLWRHSQPFIFSVNYELAQ
jgi:hypothetical protein